MSREKPGKEIEKVKKRLQERQKAEKEAKEQRVAKLLDELNQLVGLDNVKEEVRSLVESDQGAPDARGI